MELDNLREFCLKKKWVKEEFPFDEDTLVFKVGSKMFCLVNLIAPISINIKCNPEEIPDLIEEYEEILPGYHMNKKYWITLKLEGKLTNKFIFDLIDKSYELVFEKLTLKEKKELNNF
ncbi:MAG: MmcQ/YjbR family DNA-binding protein [Ignavibacteriales bacterium]|nr:MmcQ/YjbR family DNA-binding protein [Ignavibacteriales bacterium]MBK7981167.1 MmcQ/YjbR family DNA-binding protein [Ignavibacteriota bacterium]